MPLSRSNPCDALQVKKQHKEAAAAVPAAAQTPSGVVPDEDIFDDVGYAPKLCHATTLCNVALCAHPMQTPASGPHATLMPEAYGVACKTYTSGFYAPFKTPFIYCFCTTVTSK